jgi:hypothetical protein
MGTTMEALKSMFYLKRLGRMLDVQGRAHLEPISRIWIRVQGSTQWRDFVLTAQIDVFGEVRSKTIINNKWNSAVQIRDRLPENEEARGRSLASFFFQTPQKCRTLL